MRGSTGPNDRTLRALPWLLLLWVASPPPALAQRGDADGDAPGAGPDAGPGGGSEEGGAAAESAAVGEPTADPEGAAAAAYTVHTQRCAQLGAGASYSDVSKALAEVRPVLEQVGDAYEETGASYLLYWKGILLTCINQDDLAANNFRWFLGSQEQANDFPNLARDAQSASASPRPPCPRPSPRG